MELVVIAILACALGLLIGWLAAARRAGGMASDLAVATMRAADAEVIRRAHDEVERERDEALRDNARLSARMTERDAAHARAIEALDAQFAAAAARALETAQAQFLARADDRFRQSEEAAGQNLRSLLQPVSDRLQRYEDGVAKVEAERRDAFGALHGQIEAMRAGQERVSGEAAKLVNALRNAPKARGRWGEQQLRNVLETCGLAEHTDFRTEVSVGDGEGGRLRPDAIVRVPGGKALVIDAKVSLNAYQDAFGAVDESERQKGLVAHAASMRAHVNALGNKAYWSQFDDAPDYVIMFIPGEQFLTAALEHESTLWDYAFERRVLLATPTNLIAIARTVSAIWRQELLANQAREIAAAGKELYARLATMGGHVSRLGKDLDNAVKGYNAFVGSLERKVITQAKRLEALHIDTGTNSVDSPPLIERQATSLSKLTIADEPVG